MNERLQWHVYFLGCLAVGVVTAAAAAALLAAAAGAAAAGGVEITGLGSGFGW